MTGVLRSTHALTEPANRMGEPFRRFDTEDDLNTFIDQKVSEAKSKLHKTSCQLGVYTQPYVQDDARRVSREHRDVVTSTQALVNNF